MADADEEVERQQARETWAGRRALIVGSWIRNAILIGAIAAAILVFVVP